MAGRIVPASFSAKSKKTKNFEKKKSGKKTSKKKTGLPPTKPMNSQVRSREYLTPAEIRRVREKAKKLGRHGFRDELIIMMMYRHGLRVGELINLKWDQVDFTRSRLHVNRLKNGDPSIHQIEGDELRALRKLKRDYPESDFVFTSERLGPLSSRTIHNTISQAGQEANLKFPIHPHMMRHARGHRLANEGVDTRSIQAYLGHKSILHTVIYTKLNANRFKGFSKD